LSTRFATEKSEGQLHTFCSR